jgi:dGTPase
MSDSISLAADNLRNFLFQRVYQNEWRSKEEEKCRHVMKTLFHYFCDHTSEMPWEYAAITMEEGRERGVCDYLACMTDRYALSLYHQLYIPTGFSVAFNN